MTKKLAPKRKAKKALPAAFLKNQKKKVGSKAKASKPPWLKGK